MNLFKRLFKKRKIETEDNALSSAATFEATEEISSTAEIFEEDSMEEMQKVAQTVSEIKKQNPLQALLSGSKNERALAENDALISNVIKHILNWLAVITSAETVRKEEYDTLTSQMLQLDGDVNAQVELQVKFKKAYQTMLEKQEEQKALADEVRKIKKENLFLKFFAAFAAGLAAAALIVALL